MNADSSAPIIKLSGSTITVFSRLSTKTLIFIRRGQTRTTTAGIYLNLQPVRKERPGERSQITRSFGCMSCLILKPQ